LVLQNLLTGVWRAPRTCGVSLPEQFRCPVRGGAAGHVLRVGRYSPSEEASSLMRAAASA
jgi:hypothetical protein